ncbi:uncharacterized protein LOC124196344 [Daphnia pulex]|uniref:uncharacterized protein LOC124196344 n=1 Tax=Daphnia pulex TaxID=6669 RepID=UPI001EDD17D0|nr:uncharacterized protein LOC124196344 [Daphnia pulex]
MVNYSVVLLLGVSSKSVSLTAGSTTGIPMSPGNGGYQAATPTLQQLTQRQVTTPLRHRSVIPQLTLLRTITPTPRSITLPRVATPPRNQSTTRLCMLPPHPTIPRLPSTTLFSTTYYTDAHKYCPVPSYYTEAYCSPKRSNTTLKRQTTTLPRSTQPQPARYYAATTYYIEAKYLRTTLNRTERFPIPLAR